MFSVFLCLIKDIKLLNQQLNHHKIALPDRKNVFQLSTITIIIMRLLVFNLGKNVTCKNAQNYNSKFELCVTLEIWNNIPVWQGKHKIGSEFHIYFHDSCYLDL